VVGQLAAGPAGDFKRSNTEKTVERRRAQRKKERSFGRLEAKAPASLRKITQGRQDDDARRIVRKAEGAEKAALVNVRVVRAVNRISRYS
jgi:hypothetical protein